MTLRILPALAGFALLAACSNGDTSNSPVEPDWNNETENGDIAGTRPAGEARLITVEGRIEAGAECPVIETPEGVTYSLSTDRTDISPGDHVRITGEMADASFCMEGAGTLIVEQVETID